MCLKFCVSFTALGVCVKWSTTSSRSLFEMSEQTFSAPTLLASATTGTNNFLTVSTRTKKTHSQPKQTEGTFTALRMLRVIFLPHRSQSRHHGQAFCESSQSWQPRPDKCVTKSVILCYVMMLTTNIKLMNVCVYYRKKTAESKEVTQKKHTNHTYKCTDPADTHKHIHLSKICKGTDCAQHFGTRV